ncbi:NAD(P)H-dependent glycerol-3-phosphate dehydrogenase [Kistimonas scapharcae]|uniref:Glycerol-3-phosphate dehydrogenase [NAD(P)+] n=1 Tax=Kistimonas scapharcae TaxID=1036133 RepID=A0ABP8V1F9_9GAMM
MTEQNRATKKRRITVVGGGSFGTALADISATKGNHVRQWMRSAEQAEAMNTTHVNERYLPGFTINQNVVATSDLAFALESSDLVFVAIPSKAFREVVRSMKGLVDGKLLVSTTKGVEAETFDLMSEILHEELPGARIGVLSGPNLAKEIMAKCITATVIACEDDELCQTVQEVLHCDYFRVYANHDRYGVELGGALKNIYAIVSGLAEALGMGENTKSLLITRALAEMGRFAVTMGANPLTFLGLAGVGDLIVTCTSNLSRNFRVGYALGEGKSLEAAEKALGQVAEGINTLKLVKEKADEMGVYMPIATGLYEIIFNGHDIADIARTMMLREQKTDVEFILQQS